MRVHVRTVVDFDAAFASLADKRIACLVEKRMSEEAPKLGSEKHIARRCGIARLSSGKTAAGASE
jgi:hypothetical protein